MTPNLVRPVELFLYGAIALVALFLSLLPKLTRPQIYFSVTVISDFRIRREARSILRCFRAEIWVHTAIGIMIVLLSSRSRMDSLRVFGPSWQLVGALFAFLRARSQALSHSTAPSLIREAALAPRQFRWPGGWILQLGPFLIVAIVAAYLWANWNEIPQAFATYWRLGRPPGEVAARSVQVVFGPLLVLSLVCALMALIAYGILNWSRQIVVEGSPAGREERFRYIQMALLLAGEYFLVGSTTSIANQRLTGSCELS